MWVRTDFELLFWVDCEGWKAFGTELCVPVGGFLFFEYSFGDSSGTKGALEEALRVDVGMTVSNMTLLK